MNETITWAVNNYATILSGITFIFGLIVVCKKWIINAIRSINLSSRFHVHFGNFPADKIKEIHETIRKSHNILEIRQSISEKYLQIGIFMCEADTGKCLWSNDYINEFFGLDSAAMKGFGWLLAIDEEERSKVHEVWMNAVKNKTPYDCEYTVINQRDQTKRCVVAHAIAVLDEFDKIVCYVGYITQCK